MANTTIITGYYGSGKTEFCVNYALHLIKLKIKNVVIADLDIINPYFRSRERVNDLKEKGIKVMGDSLNNNMGQDLPAVSFAFTSSIARGDNVIMDLGGGENGIKLLASCYQFIKDYEFLCVLNLFRPETDSVDKMISFIKNINKQSRLPITGLVNNGHMLRFTEGHHILSSQDAVLSTALSIGLPLKYTMLKSDIYNKIKDNILSENIILFDNLQMRESWQ